MYCLDGINCECWLTVGAHQESPLVSPMLTQCLHLCREVASIHCCWACSVVAAIKHMIAPVCTWKREDVDDICVEGCQLVRYIAMARQDSGSKHRVYRLIGEHTVFGQKWKVDIGPPVYRFWAVGRGGCVVWKAGTSEGWHVSVGSSHCS